MGFYNEFPNTNFYNQDLGWLIRSYETLTKSQEDLNKKYELLMQIYENVKENIKDITIDQLQVWLEDGTLRNLINNELGLITVFDTTEEMLASTKLQVGQIVQSNGYYSVGDGGGARFVVTNEKNDFFVGQDVWFKILEKEVCPDMFGAKGDDLNNDTDFIQKAINFSSSIYLNKKTYRVNTITINKPFTINGNNGVLKSFSSNENLLNIPLGESKNTIYLFNIEINALGCDTGIYINGNVLRGDNITITNATRINLHVVKTYTNGNCFINNIKCESSQIGIQIDATDCFISNYIGHNCLTHLKIRGGLTHLNTIHGWNFNTNGIDWITNSTLIDTNSNISGSDIYCDTLENAILLPTGKQYLNVVIQNLFYFLNTSSYPSTQQQPTLLKNYENFNGYCKLNGVSLDSNGWKDSNNIRPSLPNYNHKISVTDLTVSGWDMNFYNPLKFVGDFALTSINYTKNYLNANVRKYYREYYRTHISIVFDFASSVSNNTIMTTIDFINVQNKLFSNANMYNTSLSAVFFSTSSPGVIKNLGCYMDGTNTIYIYNNTGETLSTQGNYGKVLLTIDYDNIDFINN